MKYLTFLFLLLLMSTASYSQTWADYNNKSFKGNWFLKSEAGVRNSTFTDYTLKNFTWYARPGIGYRFKNYDFEGGISIHENINGYTDQRLWQAITIGFTSFKGGVKVMTEQIASKSYNVRYRVGFFTEHRFIAFSSELLYLSDVEARTWLYGKFTIPLFDVYIGGGFIMTDKANPAIRLSLKSTTN